MSLSNIKVNNQKIIDIDNNITYNSSNLVNSGGLYNSICSNIYNYVAYDFGIAIDNNMSAPPIKLANFGYIIIKRTAEYLHLYNRIPFLIFEFSDMPNLEIGADNSNVCLSFYYGYARKNDFDEKGIICYKINYDNCKYIGLDYVNDIYGHDTAGIFDKSIFLNNNFFQSGSPEIINSIAQLFSNISYQSSEITQLQNEIQSIVNKNTQKEYIEIYHTDFSSADKCANWQSPSDGEYTKWEFDY